MTTVTPPILQPQRGAEENFSAYKARRANAHEYVKATSAGHLIWNPKLQGTYVNEERKRLGKKATKQMKVARRLAREKMIARLAATPAVETPPNTDLVAG